MRIQIYGSQSKPIISNTNFISPPHNTINHCNFLTQFEKKSPQVMQCLRVLRNPAPFGLRTITPWTATRAAFSTGQARLSEAYAYDKYKSPFTPPEQSTTKIPDFTKYKSSASQTSNKVFGYFMAGTMGVLSAAGAKAIVQGGVLFFAPTPNLFRYSHTISIYPYFEACN